jgi:putative flavoprotein involved in K+ transport
VNASGLPGRIETVIVGAGQAGLTMSALLAQAGREHIVLERRATLGGGWQDRWDDFRLVTPNWTASFPGLPYDGDDPDGYMPRREITARVARLAEVSGAPVLLETGVERLEPRPDGPPGFRLTTARGTLDAERVIVATGGFQIPKIPPVTEGLSPRVSRLHSQAYRSERALPPGAVLVVGSGQTGVQLAEELHEAGRRVFLSVGHCGRVPRRYRGHDVFHWLSSVRSRGPEHGLGLPTVAQLPGPRARFACNPHLSGHGGGHDTNLRRFAAEGMTLVGRLEGFDGERARFAEDLGANLAFADAFFDSTVKVLFDTFIERSGEDAPPDDPEAPFELDVPEVTELDLAREGISSVIFASGYRFDFGWIDLPILDELGVPRQTDGLTEVPGLAFVGLPWMRDQASATLFGVGRDAAILMERLEGAR